MSNHQRGYLLKADTERTLLIGVVSIGFPMLYFHKHRKVLTSSVFAQKSSSYYNPQANQLGYSE